jgi:hypothetical protein
LIISKFFVCSTTLKLANSESLKIQKYFNKDGSIKMVMQAERTQQTIELVQQPIESVNIIQKAQTATFIRHYEQIIKGSLLTQFHSVIAEGGINIGLENCVKSALFIARQLYPSVQFSNAYQDGVNIVFIVNPQSIKDIP